ncbi:MAG TPA: cytochrome d ubiquinol oxidase subunit II [Solirubrobacteraceae bacterium]|jgi:cytochrome d ubiquinol oxidase subunit II|nr:cytochrome d ubiquinol oxidase subunit II [Solirubrobacteraceae bacterium]
MDDAAFTFVWVGMALYALLAGADFGVGLWVLVAAFAGRGEDVRRAAFGYFGPVWEVNGLFLVFWLVSIIAAFPRALAVLATALIPLVLAALVMFVIRSAAYAMLHHGPDRYRGVSTWAFGISSVAAAAGLGYAAVAPVSGFIRGDELDDGFYGSAVALTAIPLTLAAVAHLAAVVIAAYAAVRHPPVVDWFRRAALVAGALVLPLTIAFTIALAGQVQYVEDRLTDPVVIPMLIGGVLIFLGTVALWARRYARAAVLVFAGYFCGLVGGAFVPYPYMVLPDLTVAEAAAPDATLTAYLIVTGAGAPLLVAALLALYHTALGPGRGDRVEAV